MTPEQQLQIQSAETLSELRLIEIIREQESELKAGAHMLADMHNKKNDLEAEIKRLKNMGIFEDEAYCKIKEEFAVLKARLKPVEDVYERLKHLDMVFTKKNLVDLSDPIQRSFIDCWNAIKSACEKEQPDETKK